MRDTMEVPSLLSFRFDLLWRRFREVLNLFTRNLNAKLKTVVYYPPLRKTNSDENNKLTFSGTLRGLIKKSTMPHNRLRNRRCLTSSMSDFFREFKQATADSSAGSARSRSRCASSAIAFVAAAWY